MDSAITSLSAARLGVPTRALPRKSEPYPPREAWVMSHIAGAVSLLLFAHAAWGQQSPVGVTSPGIYQTLNGANGDPSSGTDGSIGGTLNIPVASQHIVSGLYGVYGEANGGNGASPPPAEPGSMGGAGGTVTVTVTGSTVVSTGSGGAAIGAKAAGGDGGSGVPAKDGGMGGGVTINVDAASSLTTQAASSAGIFAQSVGGSGVSPSSNGDPGSAGGNGGTVTVTNSGTVLTTGNASAAIRAESNGGNGGNGTSILFGDGGNGGAGGKPGSVVVTNGGSLRTQGANAAGIFAQSLGGAGGNGGAAGFFGAGGDGGNGGQTHAGVTVSNSGNIQTSGSESNGVYGSSVGGGGGNAEVSGGVIVVGGRGGSGANGGSAQIATSGGNISTSGTQSTAILVQSVGGGGGRGGNATAVGAGAFLVSVAVGGDGGSGGDGGQVTGSFSGGTISTTGTNSQGIELQSIGKGGGVGGSAGALTVSPLISIAVAAGGTGGTGGNGGDVTANFSTTAATAGVVSAPVSVSTSGANSIGVRAASIGGGGGNAGMASTDSYTLALPLNPENPGSSAVSIAFDISTGGTGGTGGNGGQVTINNQLAAISTQGADSTGILAQSIGGGGGVGGGAFAPLDATTIGASALELSATVSRGGRGGAGGNGRDVRVTNNNSVNTAGVGAVGIFVQSVGKGGGAGGQAQLFTPQTYQGFNFANSLINALTTINTWLQAGERTIEPSYSFQASVSVALGGAGGTGGNGGNVEVVNDTNGAVHTRGQNSAGILAQSVGGGGGMGGVAGSTSNSTLFSNLLTLEEAALNAAAYAKAYSPSVFTNVNVGGAGGAGGTGGTVTVTNRGSVITDGKGAPAVFAQSVGGGGGSAVSMEQFNAWNLFGLSKDDPAFDKAVGIINDLSALWAGKGDAANVTVSVGGQSGSSGNAGAVTVDSSAATASLTTNAGGAPAILAQSIAGGGGNSATESLAQGNTSARLTLGGSGSSLQSGTVTFAPVSGDTGTVTVRTGGTITTTGNGSPAVLAQSVVGGGGVALSDWQQAGVVNPNTSVCTHCQTGFLQTSGVLLGATSYVDGIDGGNGLVSGNAGQVHVTAGGTITTSGTGAAGVMAQNISGGGGAVTINLSNTTSGPSHMRLGMMGRSGSPAQVSADQPTAVTVEIPGTVTTTGALSPGVLAQAVGGGGGFAQLVGDPVATYFVALGGGQAFVNGYNNGSASTGRGGIVNASVSGGIETRGKDAVGMLAQSVGAGGGIAGMTTTSGKVTLLQNSSAGPVGGYGDGAAVTATVDPRATVKTQGDGAVGVLAQSVGGGGGITGDLAGVNYLGAGAQSPSIVVPVVGGLVGNAGQGGTVTVNANGSISTEGANAPAILAMSVGGGAVLYDKGLALYQPYQPGGNSGLPVSVTVGAQGVVQATGNGSPAIYAVSTGTSQTHGTGGNIDVTVAAGGSIQATSGHAVAAVTDAATTVNNSGSIAVSPAALGAAYAIYVPKGMATINNSGTVAGSVLANVGGGADGVGTFNNNGTFFMGPTVTGVSVLNSGTLAFNDAPGQFTVAHLTNGLTEVQPGRLIVSADFARQQSDQLLVDQGFLLPAQLQVSTASLLPNKQVVIAQSPGGMWGDVRINQPLLYTYGFQLSADTTQGIVSVRSANFTPSAVTLNANQTRIANMLQGLWDRLAASPAAASNQVDAAAALFGKFAGITTSQQYVNGVRQIAHDASHAWSTQTTQASYAFLNRMMSCPRFVDVGTQLGEEDCVWARAVYGDTDRDTTAEATGYHARGVTLQLGMQHQFVPDWFVGGSLAYSPTQTSADGLRQKSDAVTAGVVLKHQLGPWLFAGALHMGYNALDTDRTVNFDGTPLIAHSSPHVFSVGGRLRTSYELPLTNWYVKPSLDLDVLHQRQAGYQESGAGLSNLAVTLGNQTSFMTTPGVEIGARIDLAGATLRPYAILGLSYLANGRWTGNMQLAELSGLAAPFQVSTDVPKLYGNVTAGVELLSQKGLELRAEYGLSKAHAYLQQTATLRAAMHF